MISFTVNNIFYIFIKISFIYQLYLSFISVICIYIYIYICSLFNIYIYIFLTYLHTRFFSLSRKRNLSEIVEGKDREGVGGEKGISNEEEGMGRGKRIRIEKKKVDGVDLDTSLDSINEYTGTHHGPQHGTQHGYHFLPPNMMYTHGGIYIYIYMYISCYIYMYIYIQAGCMKEASLWPHTILFLIPELHLIQIISRHLFLVIPFKIQIIALHSKILDLGHL